MDNFDDNYEKLFGELNTPRKNSNDISWFNDNTLTFLSPSTKCLHQDIAEFNQQIYLITTVNLYVRHGRT